MPSAGHRRAPAVPAPVADRRRRSGAAAAAHPRRPPADTWTLPAGVLRRPAPARRHRPGPDLEPRCSCDEPTSALDMSVSADPELLTTCAAAEPRPDPDLARLGGAAHVPAGGGDVPRADRGAGPTRRSSATPAIPTRGRSWRPLRRSSASSTTPTWSRASHPVPTRSQPAAGFGGAARWQPSCAPPRSRSSRLPRGAARRVILQMRPRPAVDSAP